MRISDTKAVQLVESSPPQVVIIDDSTGEEISCNTNEFHNLRHALDYFAPHMEGRGVRSG